MVVACYPGMKKEQAPALQIKALSWLNKSYRLNKMNVHIHSPEEAQFPRTKLGFLNV